MRYGVLCFRDSQEPRELAFPKTLAEDKLLGRGYRRYTTWPGGHGIGGRNLSGRARPGSRPGPGPGRDFPQRDRADD